MTWGFAGYVEGVAHCGKGSMVCVQTSVLLVWPVLQEPNILISLGEPRGLIAAANIMVALHVLAGYQVTSLPTSMCRVTSIAPFRLFCHTTLTALLFFSLLFYVC
jgi:hypothetical protein